MSFAQQRVWFINRLDTASPAYNLPAALRLRGNLDVEALRGRSATSWRGMRCCAPSSPQWRASRTSPCSRLPTPFRDSTSGSSTARPTC
ncbi:hypothetical protein [Gordonia sp. CNJ-863]|uniref:hypothetical protein n=1 Tax=Gordonia sp. CNJ-863 TaxID=1904963 RepID=UPI0037C0D9FD